MRPIVTYIGKGVKRKEDPQLVTSSGAFIDDFKPPGMLHAVVSQSAVVAYGSS